MRWWHQISLSTPPILPPDSSTLSIRGYSKSGQCGQSRHPHLYHFLAIGRDTVKGNIEDCAARCITLSSCQPTADERGTAEDQLCISVCFNDCICTPRAAFRDKIDNQITRD